MLYKFLPDEIRLVPITPTRRPKPDDRLTYKVFGGAHRRVRITDVEDDIKNDKPGFSGVTVDGLTVWGYDDQIIRYHP